MKLARTRIGTLTLMAVAVGSVAIAKTHNAEKEAKIVGTISVKGLAVNDFAKAAKISAGDATRAATDAVRGEVLSVSLEREDGYLIYAVNVVNRESGRHEVLVDAGNGKMLADERKDKSESGEAGESEDGDDD